MPRDGEVVDRGRWCEGCNRFHGIFYMCEHYKGKEAIVTAINKGEAKLIEQLKDPSSGIDQEARAIFSFMAGIDLEEEE